MQYILKCHDCGNTCEVASYISQRVRRENAVLGIQNPIRFGGLFNDYLAREYSISILEV